LKCFYFGTKFLFLLILFGWVIYFRRNLLKICYLQLYFFLVQIVLEEVHVRPVAELVLVVFFQALYYILINLYLVQRFV